MQAQAAFCVYEVYDLLPQCFLFFQHQGKKRNSNNTRRQKYVHIKHMQSIVKLLYKGNQQEFCTNSIRNLFTIPTCSKWALFSLSRMDTQELTVLQCGKTESNLSSFSSKHNNSISFNPAQIGECPPYVNHSIWYFSTK